jgi:CAAX protease family protein
MDQSDSAKPSGGGHNETRSMSIANWRDVWRRFSGRGTYPHELAFLLRLPGRGLVLSPRKLVERLHLKGDSRVLEIGPGPGYFSVQVARGIPHGQLVLFDLQREMLQKVRTRLRRAGVTNVRFIQGDAQALPFRLGGFDVAFLVAVLGEVPDPAACVMSLGRVLQPGALLSITELPGDPDALSLDEVGALAEASGFELAETFPVPGGFTVNFRRTRADTPLHAG